MSNTTPKRQIRANFLGFNFLSGFLLTPVQTKIMWVQSSHVWRMIYNVWTLNRIKPDKTYNTTMYVRPAKTQVSLCIDPLDKASFLHRPTVRSAMGLNRMCCCSRTVYSALDSPAIDGKYDQRMLLSECAGAYWPRVFAPRTRRFVTPSDHRGYLRLAKALIRLLRSADVQSQSVQADRLFVQVLL